MSATVTVELTPEEADALYRAADRWHADLRHQRRGAYAAWRAWYRPLSCARDKMMEASGPKEVRRDRLEIVR